jgi:hypothetical protein
MLEEAVASLREVRHTGIRNLKMPDLRAGQGESPFAAAENAGSCGLLFSPSDQGNLWRRREIAPRSQL